MRKVYLVTQELEYLVVAESEEAAKQLAVKSMGDDQAMQWTENWSTSHASHLPGIYENDSEEIRCEGGDWMKISEALKLPGGYNHKAEEAVK